jgi:methylated-DNA-[protein]-cysteine S-methyltransferase
MKATAFYQIYESPIGKLYIGSEGALLSTIVFESQWTGWVEKVTQWIRGDNSLICQTTSQLEEYFFGLRKSFNLPYLLQGTAFQRSVWSALLQVPYGETTTYRHQAEAIGNPRAVRAVGQTNGLNRLCIIFPCHRVIASNGSLSGYAGGVAAKRYLIDLENGTSF